MSLASWGIIANQAELDFELAHGVPPFLELESGASGSGGVSGGGGGERRFG